MKAKDLCDFPDTALGKKLHTWQSLVLHKVIPSSAGLFLYIILIVADAALVYQHTIDGNKRWATVTILLSFTPAVVTMVFTLSSPSQWPRNNMMNDEDAIDSEKPWDYRLNTAQIKWLCIQILNVFIFPVATISRYCHQVFWSIEVVCATRIEDHQRTEEALIRLYEPSPVELYLFLQPFLHSAPNALLQLDIILGYKRDHNPDTASMQILSIAMSVLRMAVVATVYQRFERQKVVGRRYPWYPLGEEIVTDNIEATKDQEHESPLRKSDSTPSFGLQDECDSFDGTESMIDYEEATNLNVDVSKNRDKSFSIIDRVAKRRSSASDYLSPARARASARAAHDARDLETAKASEEEREIEFRKLVSVEENDKVEDRVTQYNITDMSEFTTPPSTAAPRLSTMALRLKNRIATGAGALAERVPQRRARPASPELPVRVKAAVAVRGLDRDDFAAMMVEFVAWFLFIVSRMLTLCSFTSFFPLISFWLMFAHYSLMTIILLYSTDKILRRAFYIFLGFVYVFCLIEFKIRFRHVRLWYAGWVALCAIEIVGFTGSWTAMVLAPSNDNSSSDWWHIYTIVLIGSSTILSYACALVYIAILKPSDKVVYAVTET